MTLLKISQAHILCYGIRLLICLEITRFCFSFNTIPSRLRYLAAVQDIKAQRRVTAVNFLLYGLKKKILALTSLSTFISEEARINLLIISHDVSFSSLYLKVED